MTVLKGELIAGVMTVNQDYILALDIGTRTIIGLLCRVDSAGSVAVEHYYVESHPQRAMLDGQIHDVGQVSSVLTRVKENLQEQSGLTLGNAAIAAAGRALSTLRVSAELDFPAPQEISAADLHQLELKGLTLAREEMGKENTSLYCVGFSPVVYTLNGTTIANPLGQRGNSIGVEMIATFLPQVVVDGLYSALEKAGLSVHSLTLEPIAAMAVAVPSHLRMLNIALVDIGAGTSDIAVSREGTVLAYDMVDIAGDEITEIIAQHYLLDFNKAETIKVELSSKEQIEFVDVLGNCYSETKADILKVIEPAVDKLASTLAEAIKKNNAGQPPAALFCVGGGSRTPLLRDYLSLHLDLPLEKIGIRTKEHLEGVVFPSEDLSGPELVTPLGIALTAVRPQGEQSIKVWINGRDVTLFNVQKTTVAQALIHGGIDIQELANGAPASLEFELNGAVRSISGQAVEGEIFVNDVAATLDTQLLTGDRVDIKSEGGVTPAVELGQLAEDFRPIEVTVNGNEILVPQIQRINGFPALQDTVVQPGDHVEIRPPQTVEELATIMDLDLNQIRVLVDSMPATPSTPIFSGSVLSLESIEGPGQTELDGNIVVNVNGRNYILAADRAMLMYALAEAKIDTQTQGSLMITVNGKEADYTTMLAPGDRIEVFWAGAKKD